MAPAQTDACSLARAVDLSGGRAQPPSFRRRLEVADEMACPGLFRCPPTFAFPGEQPWGRREAPSRRSGDPRQGVGRSGDAVKEVVGLGGVEPPRRGVEPQLPVAHPVGDVGHVQKTDARV